MRAAFGFGFGLPLGGGEDSPAVDWNFAGGALPSALTFSRASLATMYDAAGALVWCPHNLLTYSEQIDNAAWSKSGGTTVTPNSTSDPNGGATADTVAFATTGEYAFNQYSTPSALQNYVFSIWLRAASPTTVKVVLQQSGGAQSSTTASVDTTWQRVQVSYTTDGAPTFLRGSLFPNANTPTFYAWGAQINVGALQPYYPTTSAAYYGPRLTYDPVTHAALGLLVEEQRTNLLAYSEQLDNAAWVKRGTCTITANAATAPDGQVSADLVAGVGIGGNDLYQSNVSISAPTRYEISFYIKKVSTSGVLAVQSPAAPANGYWTVDLSLLGSGWERITRSHAAVTITTEFTGSGGAYNGPHFIASSGGPLSFYLWGLQAEIGSFATSYIPTGAASATRAADVVTCTGAAFSQWFNAAEGTLVVEAVMPNANLGTANVINLVYIGDGPGNEYIKVYQYEAVFGAAIRHGGAWQADVSGTKTAGVVEKIAVAWAANDAAVAIRGSLVGTDATVALPTGIDRLTLGTGSTGAVACTIKRVRYWRKRITNAQLQALTA